MKFWKLLASLWRTNRTGRNPLSGAARTPFLDSLHEMSPLEGRNVLDAPVNERELSQPPRIAEVTQLSVEQRHSTHSKRQFVRLSVAIVDYLLEHEWLSLLVGRRSARSAAKRRTRTKSSGRTRSHDRSADPTDDANRTACVGDSEWSIVAAIDQPPPPNSTSSTDH